MSSRNQRTAKRRGFNNIFKRQFEVVNVSRLSAFEEGSTVNPASLSESGIVAGKTGNIKVLGDGDLKVRLRIEGVHVSAGARRKIEDAGGTVESLPGKKSTESEETTNDSSGA